MKPTRQILTALQWKAMRLTEDYMVWKIDQVRAQEQMGRLLKPAVRVLPVSNGKRS